MTPTANPTVNVSVSDPVSADIQAICKAAESLCTFLCTPEGQAACAAWRNSSTAWNAALAKGAQWFKDLFAGKLL